MAVDEALLDRAIEHGEATLRFYRWTEPTLSLGYFQRYEDRAAHPASAALPCVRRHSGGGAIVHDRELTYSLALPASRLPAGGPEALYRSAHATLIAALEALAPGLAGRLRLWPSPLVAAETTQRAPGGTEPSPGGIDPPLSAESFLCFQRRSVGDLVVSGGGVVDGSPERGHKVAGSAQRKRRGAVLQHGSVLLARSPQAPELPGVCDLMPGVAAEAAGGSEPLADRLIASWAPKLGAALDHAITESKVAESKVAESEAARAEATDTLIDRAERIAAERFGSRAWTRRR